MSVRPTITPEVVQRCKKQLTRNEAPLRPDVKIVAASQHPGSRRMETERHRLQAGQKGRRHGRTWTNSEWAQLYPELQLQELYFPLQPGATHTQASSPPSTARWHFPPRPHTDEQTHTHTLSSLRTASSVSIRYSHKQKKKASTPVPTWTLGGGREGEEGGGSSVIEARHLTACSRMTPRLENAWTSTQPVREKRAASERRVARYE